MALHHSGPLSPGEVFGRLTTEELVVSPDNKERKWLCKCSCGSRKVVRERELRAGYIKSCGCLRARQEYCRKTDCCYWAASGCNYFMATGHTRLATHMAEDGSTNPHLLNSPCKEYTPGESTMRLVQPFTIHKDLR